MGSTTDIWVTYRRRRRPGMVIFDAWEPWSVVAGEERPKEQMTLEYAGTAVEYTVVGPYRLTDDEKPGE